MIEPSACFARLALLSSLLVLLLAPLTVFSAASGSTDIMRECAVLVDLMKSEGGAFLPEVNTGNPDALDCGAQMEAAGVPLVPWEERDFGRVFSRVRFISPDEALVELDYRCAFACGHGEAMRVRINGDRWAIERRWQTWMS